MNVNGIELTAEEEETFKYLLDTGMHTLEHDEETSDKADALMKKLGIFQ